MVAARRQTAFQPPFGGHQTKTQEVIHGSFQRIAGAAHLLAQKAGNVIVQGKCGPHTMMLSRLTS